MGEPASWQRYAEAFVLEEVGNPPARAPEAGCGEGELARVLARAGHTVTATGFRYVGTIAATKASDGGDGT